MPDFKAQVFVCATVDAEVDGRHCGSKGGSEIRAKFNRQIVEHGLISTAAVNFNTITNQLENEQFKLLELINPEQVLIRWLRLELIGNLKVCVLFRE